MLIRSTACALSDLPFFVNNAASEAPMIVFAIKELGKLMSIFGEREENPYARAELFRFHIDFIADVAEPRRVNQHPPEAQVDPIS